MIADRFRASGRPLVIGVFLFAILSAAGYLAVRWSAGTESDSLRDAISLVRPGPIGLAFVLVVIEFTLGGARFWLLARRFDDGFRWRDGLRVQLYLMFAAGVTPMQVGAGPAQYAALRTRGLPAHQSLAVLSIAWIGGLVALGGLAGIGLAYLALAGAASLGPLMRSLMIAVAGTVVVAAVFTLFPVHVARAADRLRSVAGIASGDRLVQGLHDFARSVTEFRESPGGRTAWLLNIAASSGAVLVRCLAGVAVLAALRIEADPVSAVARQALQFAAITVAPTPGGSGVAEVTTIGLMAGLVPAALLVPYTVLWRFFTAYTGILAGGAAVTYDLVRTRPGRVRERTESPG